MAIEKVREYFRALGMEDRIQEFDVSSATVALAAQEVHRQHRLQAEAAYPQTDS